jgi:hypothetical protein
MTELLEIYGIDAHGLAACIFNNRDEIKAIAVGAG